MPNSMFSALMCIEGPPVRIHLLRADVGEAYNSAFLRCSTKRQRTGKLLPLHGHWPSGRSQAPRPTLTQYISQLLCVLGLMETDVIEGNEEIKNPPCQDWQKGKHSLGQAKE